MAKEVTAWRWKRQAQHAESIRNGEPQVAPDVMFTVRQEGRTLLGPESVAGEEWLLANVDARRFDRSFVIDTRALPAIVEKAEAVGVICRERMRTVV